MQKKGLNVWRFKSSWGIGRRKKYMIVPQGNFKVQSYMKLEAAGIKQQSWRGD